MAFKESRVRGGVPLIPLPEFRMIRDQPQFAARREDAMEVSERVILDHAPLVVASLRPWVTEVDVNHLCDAVGETVAEEFACIGQQDANMLELVASQAICRGTPEVGGPLDAEEVPIRLDRRLLAEECSLSRTDLDFQRMRWRREESTRIPSARIVRGDVRIAESKVADVEAPSACGVHGITRRWVSRLHHARRHAWPAARIAGRCMPRQTRGFGMCGRCALQGTSCTSLERRLVCRLPVK